MTIHKLLHLRPVLVGAASFVLLLAVACGSDSEAGQTVPEVENGVAQSDGEIPTPTALPVIPPPDEVPPGLEAVWEAYSLLVREYVERDKVDPEIMTEAAIRGMVDALGDRYSAYISPESYVVESNRLVGDFQGIGAEVQQTQDRQRVMIIAPLPNTPAETAGIKPGDVIMAVDGEDTAGWSVLDAVNRIRGQGGTTVILSVVHLGAIDVVDIPIVRGTIKQDSVTARLLDDTPYGYVKINTFTARTRDELRTAIEGLKKDDIQGLVLDLRNNPGGLLTATVDVASEFVTNGVVTFEVDGRGNRKDWRVRNGGQSPEIPLVILINAYSASGSEVLTAALQDHDRAVAIGVTTFGKGSVNTLRSLGNGGGLYMTFARWYSPNGRLIEGIGITPDVEVEYNPDIQSARRGAEDTQMAAAIQQLDFETGNVSTVSSQ
ncbi:MAG: S41 family peptidase [Chloroflexi bacterium]|nr:S41 family peptidase [Chloroflexota bacterium]